MSLLWKVGVGFITFPSTENHVCMCIHVCEHCHNLLAWSPIVPTLFGSRVKESGRLSVLTHMHVVGRHNLIGRGCIMTLTEVPMSSSLRACGLAVRKKHRAVDR